MTHQCHYPLSNNESIMTHSRGGAVEAAALLGGGGSNGDDGPRKHSRVRLPRLRAASVRKRRHLRRASVSACPRLQLRGGQAFGFHWPATTQNQPRNAAAPEATLDDERRS